MSNHNLSYAIMRRIPPTPKTMKQILEVQAQLNAGCTWTTERLSLSPLGEPERPSVAFPFVRLGFPKAQAGAPYERRSQTDLIPAMYAARGSTKVRDNLWNAHLVVAFLRHVSAMFPDLAFELKDDGAGFVLPGVVSIRCGKVEAEREWLNHEREKVLEMTGDPQAAAPFVWAETQALQGRFFEDQAASDYMEVKEIQGLDLSWQELQTMGLESVAELVVDRVTSQPVPAVA